MTFSSWETVLPQRMAPLALGSSRGLERDPSLGDEAWLDAGEGSQSQCELKMGRASSAVAVAGRAITSR